MTLKPVAKESRSSGDIAGNSVLHIAAPAVPLMRLNIASSHRLPYFSPFVREGK